MVKRLEEKNMEYRQKWKEEELKTEELTRRLRSAQVQADEERTKLMAMTTANKNGCGDDDSAAAAAVAASSAVTRSKDVVEDLRRDLVGAARDLCCRILDNLVNKCEKTTTTTTKPKGDEASNVVSPEEVVNASIVLREDRILDIVAKLERDAMKSSEELKEAKRMLEEEEAKWEERNKDRMTLRNELESFR